MKACAFVPGHITGFFEIHDEAKDIRQRGSRGVGICLSKGVKTTVEVSEAEKQSIEVLINQKKADAKVTEFVVKKILGDEPFQVKVSSVSDLPQGQGFGMSGAGALSSSMALVEALGLEYSKDEMVCIAHWAEIMCSTGLGDVMPQSVGGAVIRKKEGCSPFGVLENVGTVDEKVVLCVVGDELSTKDIITHSGYRNKINEYGNECLQQLIKKPGLKEMMYLSLAFSRGVGLLSTEMEAAISATRRFGLASMSMLGNSIFAIGETDNLESELKNFGDTFVCDIDGKGMRIV